MSCEASALAPLTPALRCAAEGEWLGALALARERFQEPSESRNQQDHDPMRNPLWQRSSALTLKQLREMDR